MSSEPVRALAPVHVEGEDLGHFSPFTLQWTPRSLTKRNGRGSTTTARNISRHELIYLLVSSVVGSVAAAQVRTELAQYRSQVA